MRHIEHELIALRSDLIEMWKLVISQVSNAGEAILSFNQDLAMQVAVRERKVDAYELKIDNACENILALYQPVAIDLRFVLAVLKINADLERIADFAYGVARTLSTHPNVILDAEVITDTNLRGMIDEVKKMLSQGLEAFETEKTECASAIFSEDNIVDEINAKAPELIAQYIQYNPERTLDCLHLVGVYRKLERIGDHCSNIAEEIFFYVDAKVLKHSQNSALDTQ
jgi:phosphate transport system protein